MIMRILGEGQYEIAEDRLDRLNELDSAQQSAADADDEAALLAALLDTVRSLGTPLPDEEITPSDLALPDEDTSLRQVRELLAGEGPIPG